MSSEGPRPVLVVNAAAAVLASAHAVQGLLRPRAVPLQRNGDPATFWAAACAVRTGALTGALPTALATRHRAGPALLAVAGVVQLGDSGLQLWQHPRRAPVPAAMAAMHLLGALVTARAPSDRQRRPCSTAPGSRA